MYMRDLYTDHNLGFEPVSTAVAVYQVASSIFGKKKQPGTDFYNSFKNLQPGEYITSVDPTPGRSSVTTQKITVPSAPTATVSPPTPVALPQAPSMQPMSAPNYAEMPTLPSTTPQTDFTIPLLLGGSLLLLLLTKKG